MIDPLKISSHYSQEVKERRLEGDYWTSRAGLADVQFVLRLVNAPIGQLLKDPANRFATLASWRTAIQAVGAARLLEEIWAFKDDITFDRVISQTLGIVASQGSSRHLSSAIHLQAADLFAAPRRENGLRAVIEMYSISSLVEPLNVVARLNVAACRLILADDNEHSYQSVKNFSSSQFSLMSCVPFVVILERSWTVPLLCITEDQISRRSIDEDTLSRISTNGRRRNLVSTRFLHHLHPSHHLWDLSQLLLVSRRYALTDSRSQISNKRF